MIRVLRIVDGPMYGSKITIDVEHVPQSILLALPTPDPVVEPRDFRYSVWRVFFRRGEPVRYVLAVNQRAVTEYVKALERQMHDTYRFIERDGDTYVFSNFEGDMKEVDVADFWGRQ